MSAPAPAASPAPAPAAPKRVVKFTLDVTKPVQDDLIDIKSMVAYFNGRLKVKNQRSVRGKLGEDVSVSSTDTALVFSVAGGAIPKRQIKFLARKYINQQQLGNYLKVVATKPDTYVVKMWAIAQE